MAPWQQKQDKKPTTQIKKNNISKESDNWLCKTMFFPE